MNPLVAIVGPTAVGKTRLAIQLARDFNGEIVSADSRQVYRHMNIGTAKPSPEELSLVPHHLIDITSPDEEFSLARYRQLVYGAIEDIRQRGKLPLLVGGTGLYVWTVIEGWEVPRVPPDPDFRRKMEEKVAMGEAGKLYQALLEVDPESARRIDPRNIRRVIRALEVYQATRTPFSHLRQRQPPSMDVIIVGLTLERGELYRRIDGRVDRMLEQGLVDEVKKLVAMGYDFSLPAMSGIGYRQIGAFLKDEISLENAVRQTKFETHRFARHQYSWFRLKDDRINWFDIKNWPDMEIFWMLSEFLQGRIAVGAQHSGKDSLSPLS